MCINKIWVYAYKSLFLPPYFSYWFIVTTVAWSDYLLNICYLYFKMCHICLYYQNKDQKSMKWNTQILLYLLHICEKIRMLTTYIIRPIPICPFRQDGLQKCLFLFSKIKFFWYRKIFTNRKEIRKESNRRDPLM